MRPIRRTTRPATGPADATQVCGRPPPPCCRTGRGRTPRSSRGGTRPQSGSMEHVDACLHRRVVERLHSRPVGRGKADMRHAESVARRLWSDEEVGLRKDPTPDRSTEFHDRYITEGCKDGVVTGRTGGNAGTLNAEVVGHRPNGTIGGPRCHPTTGAPGSVEIRRRTSRARPGPVGGGVPRRARRRTGASGARRTCGPAGSRRTPPRRHGPGWPGRPPAAPCWAPPP